MKGHIRQRGKNSWQLKFHGERDELTGKRTIHFATFRGGKREAQKKLAELINAVNTGSYVEPIRLAVAAHVEARDQSLGSHGHDLGENRRALS